MRHLRALRCLQRAIARETWRLLAHPKPVEAVDDLRAIRHEQGGTFAHAAVELGTRLSRISELERGIRPSYHLVSAYRHWSSAGLTSSGDPESPAAERAATRVRFTGRSSRPEARESFAFVGAPAGRLNPRGQVKGGRLDRPHHGQIRRVFRHLRELAEHGPVEFAVKHAQRQSLVP